MIKKQITQIMIIVFLSIMTINAMGNRVEGFFWSKNVSKEEIISQLPKVYKYNIEIVNGDKVYRGNIEKKKEETIIELFEPALLSGMQICYRENEVLIKYKEIETIFKKNTAIDEFIFSIILDIEKRIEEGEYDDFDVKDNILNILGESGAYKFKYRADLRKNQILSINIEDLDMIVNYS